MLRQGLRSHEPLEHRVREIIHCRHRTLVHHLKSEVSAIFGSQLTLMIDWVVEEVTLARSRVLLIVQSTQMLFLHTSCALVS